MLYRAFIYLSSWFCPLYPMYRVSCNLTPSKGSYYKSLRLGRVIYQSTRNVLLIIFASYTKVIRPLKRCQITQKTQKWRFLCNLIPYLGSNFVFRNAIMIAEKFHVEWYMTRQNLKFLDQTSFLSIKIFSKCRSNGDFLELCDSRSY